MSRFQVKKVAVLGAGVMGAQIAAHLVNGVNVRVARFNNVLMSEGALTAAIAICINQGIGGFGRIFSTAIGTVASQSRLNSAALLSRVVSEP